MKRFILIILAVFCLSSCEYTPPAGSKAAEMNRIATENSYEKLVAHIYSLSQLNIRETYTPINTLSKADVKQLKKDGYSVHRDISQQFYTIRW